MALQVGFEILHNINKKPTNKLNLNGSSGINYLKYKQNPQQNNAIA